jgi:hypothetical protein
MQGSGNASPVRPRGELNDSLSWICVGGFCGTLRAKSLPWLMEYKALKVHKLLATLAGTEAQKGGSAGGAAATGSSSEQWQIPGR